jgi:hypothetical protein
VLTPYKLSKQFVGAWVVADEFGRHAFGLEQRVHCCGVFTLKCVSPSHVKRDLSATPTKARAKAHNVQPAAALQRMLCIPESDRRRDLMDRHIRRPEC